jgi:hypothetical protein
LVITPAPTFTLYSPSLCWTVSIKLSFSVLMTDRWQCGNECRWQKSLKMGNHN